MGKIKNNLMLLSAGMAVGVSLDQLTLGKKRREQLENERDYTGKLLEFYHVLLQWLRVHQEGRTLKNYFERNNFHTVAIYGMKELGEALLEELRDTGIEVKYGIDRSADDLFVGIDTYKPDDELMEVDVVVVTAMHYFDSIEENLRSKMNCEIVSLEDVVWEA